MRHFIYIMLINLNKTSKHVKVYKYNQMLWISNCDLTPNTFLSKKRIYPSNYLLELGSISILRKIRK